jgi:hypothetical protein
MSHVNLYVGLVVIIVAAVGFVGGVVFGYWRAEIHWKSAIANDYKRHRDDLVSVENEIWRRAMTGNDRRRQPRRKVNEEAGKESR